MEQLTIYTSVGRKYDAERSGKDERIREFFYNDVRLAVETGARTTVHCFFRAREFQGGRAEQFYAEYVTDSSRRLFRSFKRAFEDRADQLGLTLASGRENVDVYQKLTDVTSDPPGEKLDREVISRLLGNGERLSFGVGSHDDALSLMETFVQDGSGSSAAIFDDVGNANLDGVDLRLEVGRYSGLNPLGETAGKIDRGRKEVENEYVSQVLADVDDTLRDVLTKTSIESGELERRLRNEVTVLSTPKRSSDSGRDELWPVGTEDIVLAVVLVGILLGGVAAAPLLGVGVPYASLLPWGDGSVDGSAGSVQVEAPPDGATVNSSPIHVRGNASADKVHVMLENPNQTLQQNVTVSDESFETEFALNTSGNYTAIIETPDGKSDNVTFTVELDSGTASPRTANQTTTQVDTQTAADQTTTRGENETAANESTNNTTKSSVVQVDRGESLTSINRWETSRRDMTILYRHTGSEGAVAVGGVTSLVARQ